MALLAEGFVRYPEDLPCPQVDTDFRPRERRYISDIGQVKRLRRFQSEFQGTRSNVSFVFTRAQAADFVKWYKEDIIEGGAWFYADWPLLHREKSIAYRFVTRPVFDFLARGVYHVTASVETYERKIGKAANVYTSKVYPHYFSDDIRENTGLLGKKPLHKMLADDIAATPIIIANAKRAGWIYTTQTLADDITAAPAIITSASLKRWIYTTQPVSDDIAAAQITMKEARVSARKINYEPFADDIAASNISIISGVKK